MSGPVVAWQAADRSQSSTSSGWRFDLVLAGLLVLALMTRWSYVLVHAVVLVLAVAAFRLPFRQFAWRAALWISLACLDVVLAVRADRIERHELLDLPFVLALAGAVFLMAQLRSRELGRLREVSNQMYDLIESIPAIVYVTDLRGTPRHVFVSSFVEESMGISAEQWVSDPAMWEESLAPADHDRVMEAVDRHHTSGEPLSIDYRVIDRSGKLRMMRVAARAQRDLDGRIITSVGVANDVTQLEEALRETERASAAKDTFLSRVSHELRTPLNAISGFAQLLQLEEMDVSQRESVSQIASAGDHLLQLISELLDIARIESGELSLSIEPVAVGEIVSDATRLVSPIANQSEISILVEPGSWQNGWLLADYQRLRQVLLNFLSNAIKYGGDGKTVRVGPGPAEVGRSRVVVADNGRGIAVDDLDRIFRPFERLVVDDAGIVGTGIGLAVTKTMVEAMGGSIGVDSELGVGSAFWVELPSHEPRANELDDHEVPEPADASPEPVRDGGTRVVGVVLYIEDNPSNVLLVERILARRPTYELLTAADAAAGIELARTGDPDLILLDLNLPDMTGQEALARLRGDDATADIPVAIVSADATPKRRDELLSGGAWRFLTKPLNVADLLATVDDAMGLDASATERTVQ